MALDKAGMQKDAILSVGLQLRTRSHVAFFLSAILTVVSWELRQPIFSVIVFGVIIASWAYSRKFREWELTNKDYLTGLGFEVKG